MRVLIVEDEMLIAMNTQLILHDLGHEVVGLAESSERAMELLEVRTPDLILMDIVIQGRMNGIELTEEIAIRYPRCRVIYMTAHSDEATLERVRMTPHVGLLNKPFEPYHIERALANVS